VARQDRRDVDEGDGLDALKEETEEKRKKKKGGKAYFDYPSKDLRVRNCNLSEMKH
jgi:hypothetical protein